MAFKKSMLQLLLSFISNVVISSGKRNEKACPLPEREFCCCLIGVKAEAYWLIFFHPWYWRAATSHNTTTSSLPPFPPFSHLLWRSSFLKWMNEKGRLSHEWMAPLQPSERRCSCRSMPPLWYTQAPLSLAFWPLAISLSFKRLLTAASVHSGRV